MGQKRHPRRRLAYRNLASPYSISFSTKFVIMVPLSNIRLHVKEPTALIAPHGTSRPAASPPWCSVPRLWFPQTLHYDNGR